MTKNLGRIWDHPIKVEGYDRKILIVLFDATRPQDIIHEARDNASRAGFYSVFFRRRVPPPNGKLGKCLALFKIDTDINLMDCILGLRWVSSGPLHCPQRCDPEASRAAFLLLGKLMGEVARIMVSDDAGAALPGTIPPGTHAGHLDCSKASFESPQHTHHGKLLVLSKQDAGITKFLFGQRIHVLKAKVPW